MNRIVQTEALCLRTRNWHESSRLVNLITPDLGMIAGIARGARRLKNYRAAALDLFARSRVTIYLPLRGELCTIGDAELINAHRGLIYDYERFRTAGMMARFLLRVLHRAHPEPNIFSFLAHNLRLLSENPSLPPDCGASAGTVNTSAILAAFLLKATAFLGFKPSLNTCVRCHRNIATNTPLPATPVHFSIHYGGIVCENCPSGENTRLTPTELHTLKQLIYTPAADLFNLTITPELKSFINRYICHHFNITNCQFI